MSIDLRRHHIFHIVLGLLSLASRLVPLLRRGEWLREWQAELISRRMRYLAQDQLTIEKDLELLKRVAGSFHHAFGLRLRSWRDYMLIQDLKQAVRALTTRLGFSAVVLSTLIVGIGSSTAIFSILDHVLLRPLPYQDSDELFVTAWRDNRETRISSLPYQDFQDLQKQLEAFRQMALWSWFGGTLQTPGEPMQVWGYQVTPGLLDLLGVTPAMGRDFAPEESETSAQVAILNHRVWQEHFAGDPAVLGRAITIDDLPYTVVGVLLAGFDLPFPRPNAQLWVPLDPRHSWTRSRSIYTYYGLGRVAEGITAQRLAADLEAVSQGLQEAYPDTNQDRVYYPVPLLDLMVGEARPQLLLLGGAVGLLLLIVCANLANLLLIRGLGRGQELALRLALGARRSQVVRQLLVETLLLSLIGAVGGVVAAWAVLPLLVRLAGSALPRATEIVLDVRVLLFAVAASLLSGILVGLLPALKASSVHLQQAIEHGSSRISAGVGWRKLLVTVEIGLALTLLVGTGLLVTSLVRVLRLDPGFNP